MDKLSTIPDNELVALFKHGSQQAFEELYVRYEHKLLRFCRSALKDDFCAEDIAHDVFLQVFETLEALNPEKSFYGYLQTIANVFSVIILHFSLPHGVLHPC